MPLSTAVTDFFAGLLGLHPINEYQVSAGIQTLLESNATQERRISELELELLYFKKRNEALHAQKQATQKDIAECLALGDHLVKPECVMVSNPVVDFKTRKTARERERFHAMTIGEKKEGVELTAEACRTKYKAFEEHVASLTSDMDSKIRDLGAAATQVERLTHENAILKTNRKEIHEWKIAYAEKVRRKYEEKSVKSHLAELSMAQENCNMLREERDSAVQVNLGLTGENERLNQELADERLHHQIALNVMHRGQDELHTCKENYLLLHDDWALLKEANIRSDKAYASLSVTHTEVLCEFEDFRRLYSEFLEKTQEDEKAYARLARARSASLIVQFKGEVDRIKTLVDKTEDDVRAANINVTVLKKKCDTLRSKSQRRKEIIAAIKEDCRQLGSENGDLRVELEEVVKERNALKLKEDQLRMQKRIITQLLALSQAGRAATVQRLEAALLQRADALKGQLGALKMVNKLKSGMVTDDGKEIGVFDENEDIVSDVQEDDDVVSEDRDEDGNVVSDDEKGSCDSTEADEEMGELDLDEEEGDNEYNYCGEDEREVYSSYENLSEGDLSGDEDWSAQS
ncbi:uncharacterized protein N0V89_011572 [Didymosphaeria variabile]|uniref:Uncharacterized protein n=1 Tax=Didymosphaeria variabile TaxID=1932322 RepID=A0A9W8XA04_9PLEO|nr:uncharacterized protein N0V89_011572 [Didymosphaeria variabile]KAJ4345442.1 hypothetical protein N0V89_011572 [Didymosphaeria variabile]